MQQVLISPVKTSFSIIEKEQPLKNVLLKRRCEKYPKIHMKNTCGELLFHKVQSLQPKTLFKKRRKHSLWVFRNSSKQNIFAEQLLVNTFVNCQFGNIKAAVVQIEKALTNDGLGISNVSWKCRILSIYSLTVIYSWNLLFS